MQKIFVKYLLGVVAVGFFAMICVGYTVQSRNAQEQMIAGARLKLAQVSETLRNNDEELASLKDSLREDYLTRAQAFAYIVEKNPEVINSQSELERIKKLLNVDELHVIDENGILTAGTIPKYFGMDFRSTEQTAEFLKILEDPDFSLVQDIQPNGAEARVFQYAGVARQDKKGIVQVGLAPVRLLSAQQKNELPYLISRIPVDAESELFVVDAESGEFLANSFKELEGKNIQDLGFTMDELSGFQNGGFHTSGGQRCFYLLQREEGRYLGICQKDSELYKTRSGQMRIFGICILMISVILIFSISHLLKVKILNGIHRIMEDLTDITEGNLETVVCVEDNPEFRQLSTKINQMVKSILEAGVKVSRVIDMVDMPIGVFEITADSDKVITTNRLYQILGWDEKEDRLSEREWFMERIKNTMKNSVMEEDCIYKVSENPDKWLKIQVNFDEGSIFGVVSDVTGDMLEKRKIKHERDYDALTGLRNLRRFRRKAERILAEGESLECAAMLMADLDYFKEINDQYGHDWGDEALRLTAEKLLQFEGEHGITARRSGDEFCVFLYSYDSRAALLERLEVFYQEIEEHPILFPDGTHHSLKLSIGLAWYGGELNRYDTMMKAADEALYEAKRDGRNVLRCY